MARNILPPAEAAALLVSAPDRVGFAMDTFALQFGVREDHLLADLQSGALRACEDRAGNVFVTGTEMVRWIQTDTVAAKSAREHLDRDRKPDA